MIEQTTLHNILTWIIAVILFIFQSLNYFISQIKKIVKHGQKNTTVVTKDTIILSESNPNNNNAPENVITVQGLIQKHFDIPLIISEDEQKVNDFIKNAQLLTSYENYKEKKKIDQFMEHLVDDSYVARGLGLITANVGRKAEFYLYSKYDNNFDNVVIKLKGRQGEIGQITIPNQNSTNSIDTKSIPMDYFYDEDRIKVTYTPFAEGVYTLTLVRNGLSICRSPYYISVEKSPTNSRSQIRLGTKKYKMVTKFAKAKHVPLETCDNSSPLIEPSKPSISRNILSTPEENSIRTDVMSIVTKFESNSIHFQKNDQKPRVNTSKKSTKTDLFDKISISADSNTQPEIETGNDYDTNINDLSSLSINSNSKSNNKKCSSNLDVSNRNSKSNYVNSIEIESNLLKKSNKKLDESIRNINDIPRVKNISSNHLEPTNSALLKESLNDKSLDDVEERNKTYKTNEPILGQNQIETFLDPIALVKSEIKCIDNEACTHNEVSCFDDNDRKAVIVKKNINELETHPNISMKQQFTDSTQYNINTTFTSVLTKITNDVCEKCSIKVLRILSEFPRDINITHNNNSNENCSSFETLLAQPISIHINIDNLFEKPISPTNEHKTNNLLTNSPINMKLMDTTDKDIKYHYINEIKPIDTTFNEIYCDINNTTTELIVKQNKHNGEIKKTINDKITNNFTIPLTKNNIDKPKTDHIENILSTDNKMQIQVQNVQKSSDHNMEKDKTNQIQFHEYINNELNDINKENGKILDKFDNIVTINNDKKCNEELVTKELKAKNDIISDEYKNIQSSFINSQTVLASMEDKLPTSRYKPEDIRQEISNISNTNVILPEDQKLIIENSIEPVLKSFKNEMVEKITQLYLNKDLASSENTSILENHNINLTNNLQKKQLHHNADKNKTKLTETIRSQLKNHFHINDISGMILNNKKTDNNQLYKYHENIIKTNMNPNEIHSQRLDEINFQTLESIAKNQLNKQQLDKESKIMILENVTPNIEIKKTIDDEKVQDMKIMLKNIPNGTSTKIKATTKTIKSNTSDETDVESNIDNKKKVQKIVVEIVTNNNKMIVDSIAIIIHEETEENKQVAKNNTPKPNYWIQINDHEEYTINAYHDAIKPIDKDEVIETEMTKISIKTDITIENNHKDRNEKEIEESIKHDLIIETPIIPVQKSKKVENINQTKIIQYIDSSTKHIEEPINVEIFYKQKILKNDVQTNKTKQNIKKESESCLLIDTSNVPVEQNNIIGKSIEHPISIENSNESVKESKVTRGTTETKLMQNRNSLWLNKEEAIGKENNPEIEIKTQKSIDNTIKEGEPISLIKTPIISDNEKIIIKKKIEKLNKYFKDSKEEDIKTESKSILNNDTSITNIEEPIDNEDIPETGTRTEKSRDKIYKVSDPCSPSNIPTTSDEEKIILKETVDNRLPNEPPIKSAKVEPTQNTDSKTENVDEPNDINVNPETETQIETSTDKMNTESATYSRADIPTISDEEKRTIVETTEKPLLNDQPTKSIEIETTPNTDSPTEDVEEPIDQHIIPETQTQTDISTDNINTDSETYSLADITTTSDEEIIILEETAENPILNEPPIKSAKVEPTQNTDSKTKNVDEPNDINIIPETETQIEKSKDKMNTESATCSRADIPTTSDEEKTTIEETTGKPLLNDQPTKFIEIETTPNTDSPTKDVEEPIDQHIIPETQTQTDISTDNINTDSETYSLADITTTSDEEKIILEETAENPIQNEPSIRSVDEIQVIDINTESETTTNSDSPTVNVEEPIDKDIIPEIATQTEKSKDNIYKISEPCSPSDIPTTSDEEMIILEETAENPILNEPSIRSVDEIQVIDINTESETTTNSDSPTVNVEEPIDKDIIPEIATQTEKSKENIYKISEPCSPSDILTTSDDEKIILEETVDNRLPNEPLVKSVKIEPTPNTDSKTENVDEPNDINGIPETETQIETSTDKMNTESATYSRADIPTISDEEKRTIVETTEKPLLNDQPTKSIEIETTPNTDSPTEDVEEPIDQHIIPETQTQTDISTDNINTDSETYSLADITTTSDEEKIILEETAENPILNEPPIKSAKVEPTQNTDSKTKNVDEPNDINVIPETETQIEKTTDKMNTESATCSRADIPTISDEEKRTIEETTGNPLLNDQPTKSIEIETTPNTDSPTEDVEEPIDQHIIPETQTQTDISTDNINTDSETYSLADITTTSDEEIIILEETAENPILNEPPIKSAKVEPTQNTDSKTKNVDEPNDINIIPETETQIEKTTDKMNTERATCSRADIPTISDEEKRTIEETTGNPLLNDQPTISIEIETTPNTDSPTEDVEEPIDQHIIPETQTQTDISTDNINTDSETYSLADITTTSDEEKIILEETAENPILNEPPIKSAKVEPTQNTDSKTKNVDEPNDINVIPETETQIEKTTDKMNTESATCSRADIPTISDEEKRTIEETTGKPLLNDQPTKSIEIETTPNTDSPTKDVEEPIDQHIIPETQTQTDISTDNIITDSETYSLADITTTSDEEKIILEETAENPIQNEPSIRSVDEIQVIDINTESETTTNSDSPTVNVEEPIDKDIIPEIATQTEKSKDNIYKISEPCSPSDILTTSDDEKIILEETVDNRLPNEPLVKSVKIELTPNTDSKTENVDEPNDINGIPETETQIETSTDKMNTESATYSRADIPTISDEEKRTIVETTEKPLLNDQPTKSIEIETTPNTDSPTKDVEEPIDQHIIPETQTQTDISTDNINTDSETYSLADITTTSDEEKIILEETAENPIQNEPSIRSVDEIQVIDINTESETTTNSDSPTVNVEEPIDKDIIPEIATQTEKSKDNIYKISEPCSPSDIPTTSDEEMIILEETAENPILNEPSIRSVDEIQVIDINTESETTTNSDSPTVNVEEPIDKDIIPEIATQTEKSKENIYKISEPCSPSDILTTSDDEKIILEETVDNRLPNEPLVKSVKIEPTPNTDSKTENVDEPNDINGIPETETQIETSTDKMNTESATYSRADIPTISDEEKRTIVETTEKPLLNDQPTKSIEIETTPNTDSPTEDVEEPIDQHIIPETQTQTDISTDNINTDSETYSLADITTTSDEEKIILEETAENPILNEPPIKSAKVEPTQNTDSKTKNVDEPNDINVIPETETQIEKTTDKMNTESATCSRADIPTISDEEKRTIEETTGNPLLNDQPTKSIEIETTPNTDSPTEDVEEPIDQHIIPETQTQTDISTDNINTDSETYSLADITTTSDEEIIILEETAENPILNEPPIKSAKVEPTQNTDSKTKNVDEPNDINIIPETETQIEKTTDKMNTERATCSRADIPTISDEEKRTIEETTGNPLLNDQPTISIEIETTPNTDSPTEDVEEPIDQHIIPETQTQTDISTDNINTDSETYSLADITTTSDEEKIILEETAENPILNEPPIKSAKVEPTQNTDSKTKNVDEPNDINVIPETETQIEKTTDKMNTESATCSRADIPTISDEEKRTIEETTGKPLLNDQPTKSIEIETTPNTDSPTKDVEEPIDQHIIPETQTQTDISTDNIITDSETYSLADITTTSDEEKIILEETAENPIQNEPSIRSVDEIQVIDINTESETTTNSDSPTVNVEEPIDKDIIPEIATQTEKSKDNIYKISEPCSPSDILTTSDDEKIILEETVDNRLPNEPLVKSVKIELTPNTDSKTENVDEPNDINGIPETETQIETSTDKMNTESATYSRADIPTISDEEKRTIVETTEKPLLNDQPTKSIEIETTPNTDSPTKDVEEPIDQHIIPETQTQTDISTDNIITDSETYSLADITTTSDEEKIILEETAENPIQNEPSIRSVDEIQVIDINTESETTTNSDSPTVNVEEPIDKDIIPEIATQTEKSKDNIYKISEPCSPSDIPTTSDEEKIILEETAENPILNEPSIKSVDDINVIDIITKSETTLINDSSIANVEVPINKDNVPETQIEIFKTIYNIEKESETCSHTDTSSFYIDERNIIDETVSNPLPIVTIIKSIEEVMVVHKNTESKSLLNNDSSITNVEEPAENPLLNEPPFKSEDEIKVIYINTKIETTPNTDPSTVNVEETIDKDIISETETQTGKSKDNINIERGLCSPFDTATVFGEEKIMIVETTEKLLLNETPIISSEEFKVVDINTETEPSPNTDAFSVNVEALIEKENIREFQIETDKLIDNSNKECESCFPTDKFSASDEGNNLTKETIEVLSPIEISIKSSIKSVEESKIKKVNTETVFVPNTDSLTLNSEEPLYEDYFSKIVIKTDKILDFIVKGCETFPPVDTSMYAREEIKGIDGTIEKLILIGPSFVVEETENLTSVDGFNTIINTQSEKEYLKDIESPTRIDSAAFVKDQKVEENETVIENILTINTSAASVQAQIQVEEVIKDKSVILINDSDTFDEMSPEEQKNIETVKISSITVIEEQTDINRGDVIYTCEESLDKTIVEKDIHSETTRTIDILAADVEEKRALEIELSEYATQVLNDTSTETIENPIKTKKNTENETTTPIVVAKSEVKKNEIKVMIENETSTPVHLASTNTEQTETDMVTEIASPNVNILNSNTKIVLIDKEMITENSNNPKHCYLKFGETSKIHSLENEDNLPEKSYGIKKLEMSVQRMKTSNEDYYEKTFLQLEQTEKISVENKDKVDCENKNIIDDKLYTVNESDLNAILCASSLEEALTLLDSKIKFKFKHRKLSNKANSTPHIPKIQTSESRSSGTNTNFTDAREFFKKIEKKCKK